MRNSNEGAIPSGSWSRTEVLLLRFLGTIAFTLLAVLSAQVRIPLLFTPVPMTLQTLVAPLAGGFLGATCGGLSMLLYLGLGLLGAPVFAQAAGGWQFFTSPTAGFLVGHVLAAWIVGLARDSRRGNLMLAASLVSAHVLIFICGILGFMLNTNTGWHEAFAKAVAPFLVGDTIKIAVTYSILASYNHFRKITRL